MARNRVIGNNNALPWRISADLQYFKRVTWGKPIIMGRLTFESIGKPLPGRTNIVMTSQHDWRLPGVVTVHSFSAAVAAGRDIAARDGVEEIMVIGGAQVYRTGLPHADRIYMTRVEADVAGDAFFPALNAQSWCETTIERVDVRGESPACTFAVLDRNP